MFTMLNKRNILYILQNFQLAALADIECGMGIIFRAPLVIVAPRSLEQKTNLRKWWKSKQLQYVFLTFQVHDKSAERRVKRVETCMVPYR